MHRTVVVLVPALALVIPMGCGGNGGETSGARAETVIEEEAQQRADHIGLRLSDFPSGWRTESTQEDEGEDEFRRCLGTDLSEFTVNGHTESDDFLRGDATVSSEVVVLATEEQADRVLDVLIDQVRSERFSECLQDAYEQEGNEGELTDVSSGELSFPNFAAESSALQMELSFEVEGMEVSAYGDVVFLREDRAIAQLNFADVLTPFPVDQEEDLAGKVANRMEP